jgi:hypothetical protein
MASTSSAPLLQHLESTTLPEASSLSSLPLQILTSPLRAFQHAETFALRTVPQTLARFSGMNALGLDFWSGADTTTGARDAVATAANAAANMAGDGTAGGVGQEGGYYIAEFLSAIKKVGGFFGYLTSLWSFACLVEVGLDCHRWRCMMLIVPGTYSQPHHNLCIHSATPSTRLGKTPGSPFNPYSSLRVPNPESAPRN